jgi:hypothetical protein
MCDDVRPPGDDLDWEFALIRALGIRPAIAGRTQMAKKGKKRCEQLPVLHPDAAGIDVGASELFVAVAADRDPQPVRSFPTFTRDQNALADWLQQCGTRSVAMESTSVYWIPVYQILESRGFEVYLVNAQHVKNVPGRKTDVSDCQWIQYLHSVGLLRGSFRPPGVICAIRSLWRQRGSFIQMAAEHVLHMQKALDQMNLQIHRVLNDITGLSGLRILDAILAGERDTVTLARLCHSRVKSSEDTVAKSLEGDYRREHLFALKQSLAAFRYYQNMIAETDQEIQRQLSGLETAATAQDGFAGFNGTERDFVRLRNPFLKREPGAVGGTLGSAFRVDDNADVVRWVNTDEEPGHRGILADAEAGGVGQPGNTLWRQKEHCAKEGHSERRGAGSK